MVKLRNGNDNLSMTLSSLCRSQFPGHIEGTQRIDYQLALLRRAVSPVPVFLGVAESAIAIVENIKTIVSEGIKSIPDREMRTA